MGHSDVSLSLTHIQPPSGLLWVGEKGPEQVGAEGRAVESQGVRFRGLKHQSEQSS